MVVREEVGKLMADAVRLYQAGWRNDADALCRRVLALAPGHAPALHLAGRIAIETGRPQDAVTILTRAARPQAGDPGACLLLGTAQLQLGRFEDALASFRTAVKLNPKFAEAHCARGVALAQLDRAALAIAAFAKAIELNPDLVEAHVRLADLHAARRETAGAIRHYREALRLSPANGLYHHRLGVALAVAGDKTAALGHCREAVRLQPNFVEAQYALESLLVVADRWAETVEGFELWVRAEPSSAEAHFHLGVTLLRLGRYEAGWPHFEWRRQRAARLPLHRPFRQKLWRGEDLAGRTLLVHDEEGFGDTLHFSRYLPLVAQRCARIVFETRPELLRLLGLSLDGERVAVIPRVDGPGGYPGVEGLPATDFQVPLMSLARLFGTRLETIPAETPYLRPDLRDVRAWADRLAGLKRPLVGLVWAGQNAYLMNAERSMTLGLLAPLGQIPGLTWLSLQLGPAAAEAATPPPGLVLHDFTGEIRDFAESAGLLANIDLLVTVDTAAAHLAGALGIKTWLLNRFQPDWRWLVKREDSPWYPSLRQFRQDETGDWGSVIPRLADALAAYAAEYRPG
jgi:tetratricopeptide (TPR) repeat protein